MVVIVGKVPNISSHFWDTLCVATGIAFVTTVHREVVNALNFDSLAQNHLHSSHASITLFRLISVHMMGVVESTGK